MYKSLYSLIILSSLLFIISCTDEKCTQFTPYNYKQQIAVHAFEGFSTEEKALLNAYFEKYEIRVMENAKDIIVKDKKFALIEADFPITSDFCSALEAYRAFLQKQGLSEAEEIKKHL